MDWLLKIKKRMKYTKIFFVTIAILLLSVLNVKAQEATSRYTIGDATNNEIADTVDFDLSTPILTEGDGKLYYIRKVNLHGVKYLNHSILKASAGLQEGDSLYLPSKFISNAMQRLWAPR
jgi:outer membrane protein insertion porin family